MDEKNLESLKTIQKKIKDARDILDRNMEDIWDFDISFDYIEKISEMFEKVDERLLKIGYLLEKKIIGFD